MTYLASSGDSGAGVNWPAVSSNVLAVGGTSLTYTGSGSRSESAWSGSSGGISAYEPLPVRRLYESAIGTVHETLEAAVEASVADHQAGVQHYSEVA